MVDHLFELLRHLRPNMDCMQINAQMFRHSFRIRQIIRKAILPGLFQANGEALQSYIRIALLGKRHHRTGIKTARQERPDRHIRHHLSLYCRTHCLCDRFRRFFRRHRLDLLIVRQLVVLPLSLDLAIGQHHGAPRRQLLDSGQDGVWRRAPQIGQMH